MICDRHCANASSVTGVAGRKGHFRSTLEWRIKSPLGVVRVTLPIDNDTGLVAHDPRVVPRRHDGKVSWSVFHLFAVVHHDLHPAGDEISGVGSLAAFGL